MTAGIWALERLSPRLYAQLAALTTRLAAGLAEAARGAGVALQVNAIGSLLTPFFTDRPVRDYASATSADTEQYARFFRGLIIRGVYPPPSQFEAWFLSAAHTPKDVEKTIAAARAAMRDVAAMRHVTGS
jgi:glutamate-1-semialdehyde 2,1-aminomutase